MVCLGIRRFSHALLHNLGRETFLAPVKWNQEGWPVVGNNGNGTIELDMSAPLPASPSPVCQDICIDFHKTPLDHRLFYTRNPEPANYIHNQNAGTLLMKGTHVTINEPGASPTILSFRQPQFTTTVTARINLSETDATRCGVAAYYNNDYHYEIYIENEVGSIATTKYIGFYKHIHDLGVEVARIELPDNAYDKNTSVLIKIDTDREKYTFSYKLVGNNRADEYTVIGSGLNAGLSTEGTRTMTFTGTLFSLFCENGIGVFEDQVNVKVNPDIDYKL
jgi:alpha-N-arabinofuranosidase